MGSVSKQIATTKITEPLTIASVALALRILVALLAYARRDIVSMLWPRGVEALGIAKSLLTGTGFSSPFALPTGRTAFLTPIYPLLLAGIERISGIATSASAWTILVMQCIFSAATCIPIYYLAVEIFDTKVANRATWIWALLPYAIILPTNIIWESSLSGLMLATGLLAFVQTRNSSSVFARVSLGAFWALACLVNAALLLLLPALLFFDFRRDRKQWPRAVLCIAAFTVSLMPWSMRNYWTFHKLFPLRDNFALELWIGNHEGATTRFDPEIHPAFNHNEVHRYQALGEIGYMAEKRAIAVEFIGDHPVLFVINTVRRFFTYWFVNWHALWLMVPALSLIGFFGLGLLLVRSHPLAWMFWIPLMIYPLPYYITHPDLRYQHPVQPLMAILCAYALRRLQDPQTATRSVQEVVEVEA